MPYHVEISSPVNNARVFNIDEAKLRKGILEPWVAGLPFEFDGQRWEPRESRLTILEGRVVPTDSDPAEVWSGTLDASDDVTRAMLEAAEASAPPQSAMVIEADSVDSAFKGLRGGRSPQPLQWAAAVERINNRDADLTAVILVVKRAEVGWP